MVQKLKVQYLTFSTLLHCWILDAQNRNRLTTLKKSKNSIGLIVRLSRKRTWLRRPIAKSMIFWPVVKLSAALWPVSFTLYLYSAYVCHSDSNDPSSIHLDLQLQRVASRCNCQLFFCYYSDMINMDELEENDLVIPAVYFSYFNIYLLILEYFSFFRWSLLTKREVVGRSTKLMKLILLR